MDVFPTLLELVGAKPLNGLQGHTLIPYLENQNNNTSRFIWSEDESGLILQNRNWLYYLPKNASDIQQSILYNKINDPLEKDNVATISSDLTEWAFRQTSLLDSYNTIYTQTKPVPDYDKLQLDPEKVKRLQKEGYF
jgi:arylsulfatase A-like enzyme